MNYIPHAITRYTLFGPYDVIEDLYFDLSVRMTSPVVTVLDLLTILEFPFKDTTPFKNAILTDISFDADTTHLNFTVHSTDSCLFEVEQSIESYYEGNVTVVFESRFFNSTWSSFFVSNDSFGNFFPAIACLVYDGHEIFLDTEEDAVSKINEVYGAEVSHDLYSAHEYAIEHFLPDSHSGDFYLKTYL